jgi:hypothetical protein
VGLGITQGLTHGCNREAPNHADGRPLRKRPLAPGGRDYGPLCGQTFLELSQADKIVLLPGWTTPHISCATQRELPLTAARNLATAVSPCLLWARPCISPCLTEFSQLFVGHFSEPSAQRINASMSKVAS